MSELNKVQQHGMNILMYASLLSGATYDYEAHQLVVPFSLEKSAYFSNLATFYDLTEFVEIDLLDQTYRIKLPVIMEEKLRQMTGNLQLDFLTPKTIREFPMPSFFTAINLFGKRIGAAIYIPSSLNESSINRLTIHLTHQLKVLVTRYEHGIKIFDIPKLFSFHTYTLPSFDTMQFMHFLKEEDYRDILRLRKKSKVVYVD